MLFTLVVFTPLSHADRVRKALTDAGAGKIGNYSGCSFSTKGIGRFCAEENANPHTGSRGIPEEVDEERIEVVVVEEVLQDVLRELKKVHPYEEPAIHLIPMKNYKEFIGNK